MTYEGNERPCTRCGETKPFSEFYTQKSRGGRPSSICIACEKIRALEKRDSSADRESSKLPQTCGDCGETKPASNFRRNVKRTTGLNLLCRDCVSWANVLKLYGITPAQYQEMLESQGYVCAICRRPETTMANNGQHLKKLAVDHCHRDGRIRGLLCAQCNKGLGNFQDDQDRLRAAVAYLKAT